MYSVEVPKTVIKQRVILGLAEKPTAAKRIAESLTDEKPRKNLIKIRNNELGIKFPDVEIYSLKLQNDETLVITSALGHLFTLIQNGGGWTYPTYDYKWVPVQMARSIRKKPTKHELRMEGTVEAIRELIKHSKELIIMTDYDQEGEVIGGVIFNELSDNIDLRQIKRMKFSSLTKSELRSSFQRVLKESLPTSGINWGMYHRGLMRHYLDWLWGINLSRALMLSLKNYSGKYQTLSTGRVQGPTLKFVATRQKEIDEFNPEAYYQINLSLTIKRKLWELTLSKSYSDKNEAMGLVQKNKTDHALVESIKSSQRTIKPPVPYNLSSLQRDAYRYFKISPRRALQAAEQLYLAALISYPRTSSEKYPDGFNHVETLKSLINQSRFKNQQSIISKILQGNLKPTTGKKTDPAHPAIHPTGQKPERLGRDAEKIYDLIVKRYFSTFGESVKIEGTRIKFAVNALKFSLNGNKVKYNGWWDLFSPYATPNFTVVPELKEGEKVDVKELKVIEKFTIPPPYYNEASLLKEMEDSGIGTKATRAEIIQALFNRKYVEGSQINLTRLGKVIFEVLADYSPKVLSIELSRQVEELGEMIENTMNGESTNGKSMTLPAAVLEGVEILHDMLEELQMNEEEVGETIDRELTTHRRESIEIDDCPVCGNKLQLITNKLTGKRFIGCSSYFTDKNCGTSYPLPQNGKLVITDQKCKVCNKTLLRIIYKRKKPWTFCFDPSCPENTLNSENSEKS